MHESRLFDILGNFNNFQRIGGGLDDVVCCVHFAVGEVDDDSEPFHLIHDVVAEHVETWVLPLGTANADEVQIIVGELDYPDTKPVEDL